MKSIHKMRKKWHDWRHKPKDVAVDFASQLARVRQSLAEWDRQSKNHSGDPMWNIVRLCIILAALHDREKEIDSMIEGLENANHGQHDALVKTLKGLQSRFRAAGRSITGMNRTARGELVRDSDVFLGGVYNTPLQSVQQWKKVFSQSSKESERAKLIIHGQAEEIIIHHAGPIVDLIDKLNEQVRT